MLKRILLIAAFAVTATCVAQAADFSKVPDPMKNAKVGQWVSYKIQGGMEQKQTITAIDGSGDERIITISMEMMQGGNVLANQEMKINLKDAKAQETAAREANPDVKITEEKVTVNDKEYNAVVLEANVSGMVSKTYMSADVPVTGLLKSEVSGMGVMMELADFGN